MVPPQTTNPITPGAWGDIQPKTLPQGLHNLIADNEATLNRILRTSRLELDQLIRTYQNPTELEQILRAMINRGFIVTDQHQDDLTRFKQNIGRAFELGLNGGQQSPPAVMSIIQTTMVDSVMNYVTRMDTDMKRELGQILSDGYSNRMMPRDIVRQMTDRIGINESRAGMIARTETMRSSNMASWAQNKAEGAKYFIVDHRAAACKHCIKLFRKRVFKIDEAKYIPPIHPSCACVPVYFYTKADAQEYLSRVRRRNDAEAKLLREQGYKLPVDGTGPNATGKEQGDIVDGIVNKKKAQQNDSQRWVENKGEYGELKIGKFRYEGQYQQYHYDKNGDKLNLSIKEGIKTDKNEILKLYDELPKGMRPNNIIIKNIPGGVDGRYTHIVKNTIEISPDLSKDRLTHVFRHESYHSFEDVQRALPSVDPKRSESSTNPSAQNIISGWKNAMKFDAKEGNPYSKTRSSSWVSKYSSQNKKKPSEDRAESAAMYLADKKSFKKDYPHRYELLSMFLK